MWYQYDGVVYPKHGLLESFKQYILGVENITREDALKEFFPKWSGFYTSEVDGNVTVVQALAQVSNLVETLSRPWIMTEYYGALQQRIPVDSLNLSKVGATAIILGIIRPRSV